MELINANKVTKIGKYLNTETRKLLYPKKIEYIVNNDMSILRNMIFNQMVLPVAEIEKESFINIALFDMRCVNNKTKNIILLAGNIDKDFLIKAVKKVKQIEQRYVYNKITIKGEKQDLNNILKDLINSGFEKELEIPLDDQCFFQYSMELDDVL